MSAFDPRLFDGAGFDAPPIVVTLALRVQIGAPATPTLPLRVSIADPDVVPALGDGATAATWTALVILGGADVSTSVIGDIVVDAEEGAARVADFTLHVAPGTVVTPAQYIGLPVEIWLDAAGGGAAALLFTGVVDTPSIAPNSGTIGLRCTDNLQGMIAALSADQLGALIPGALHSPAVFDAGAPSLTRAADLLSTVAASLDVSPEGVLRLSEWGSPSSQIVLDADTVLDGSLGYEPADRASVVNRVTVDFQYRFPRAKCEAYLIGFDPISAAQTSFGQWVKDGGQFLQRETVISAIERAGAAIASIEWIELPTTAVALPNNSGFWLPNPAQHNILCIGFGAVVTFDFGQEQEEHFTIEVRNEASIALLGTLREQVSGSLHGVSGDPTAAEHAALLYKKKISTIPPRSTVPIFVGYINSTDSDLTEDTDRAAADAAIACLIAIARTKIAASHRRHTVRGSVPADARIDLDQAIYVNAGGILAQGKARQVRHVLSPATGSAVTEFAIAITACEGVDYSHPDSIPDISGTTSGQGSAVDSVEISWNGGYGQDGELTIVFPALAAGERDRAVTAIDAIVDAPIFEDFLEITL